MTPAELLYERFFLRTDTYAKQVQDGDFIRQMNAVTLPLIERHLKGAICLGAYPLLGDQAKWGCVDFDAEPQVENGPRDPAWSRTAARAVVQQGKRFGVELVPEFSGSKGWHAWLFTEPMEARIVRAVLHGLVRETGEDAFTGCVYPPEIFPKHDRTEEGKEFGYLVKVPWGKRVDNGKRAVFVHPNTLEKLGKEEQLALLENARVYRAEELAELVEENGWEVPAEPDQKAPAKTTLQRLLSGTYKGDLPCFESLHDRQSDAVIPEGHRNNVFFALSNHHKRKGSSQTTAEDDILNLNQKRCRPPEPDEKRVLKTVASAYRSGDSSACCDILQKAKLCPVLSDGVYCPIHAKGEEKRERRTEALNHEDARLSIQPLRVLRTEPEPLYTVTVRGEELRLSADELIEFRRFKRACILHLNFVPELPFVPRADDPKKPERPQVIWERMVHEALQAREEEEAPPEEAGPRGAQWAAICAFLSAPGHAKGSTERAKLKLNRVLMEGDYYYFRGEALHSHLVLGRQEYLPMNQRWQLIKDKGGVACGVRYGTEPGETVRAWRIPVAVVGAAQQADLMVEEMPTEPCPAPLGLLE